MAYFPVFIDIRGKRCVVIGGGKVALRKTKALLECGAEITLVSPALNPELNKLIKKRRIEHISRKYEPEDLKDAFIIMAATDSAETNLKIALEARNQRIFVNIANNLDQSDFIIPSSFRRGDLTIAVSTAGRSPALTKKIRTRLEKIFGEEYVSLLSLVKEVRSELKQKGISISAEVWQEALDLDLLINLIQSGKQKEIKSFLLNKLEGHRERME